MPTGNSLKFIASTSEELKIIGTHPFDIRQEQGLAAYHFWAGVHNDDLGIIDNMRTNKTGPMVVGKMEITTSDDTPAGSRVIDWNGWVIVEVVPDGENKDVSMVCFADLRYVFEYCKLSAKFNVFFDKTDADGDPIPDEDSLNPTTGIAWTIGEYFKEICDLIDDYFGGAFPDLHGGLTGTDNEVVLSNWVPENLGNTYNQSGGWVAATVSEMLAPIMKAFGVTFQMGLDAKFYIVDTSEERSDIRALLDIATNKSFIRDAENSMSRPAQLMVSFEARDEIAAEVVSPNQTGTKRGLELKNVMQVPHDLLANSTGYSWVEVAAALPVDNWGNSSQFWPLSNNPPIPDARKFRFDTEGYIAENYFKEMPVPFPKLKSGKLATNGEIAEFCNAQISSNWRRVFRASFGDDGFPWVRMEIGRLNHEGGTENGGAVFCDYTYVRRRGRILPEPNDRRPVIARLQYSESVQLSNLAMKANGLDNTQPAPFRAFWSDRSELLISIATTVTNPVINKDVVVGTMVKGRELGFGNFIDFVQDGDEANAPKKWVRLKQDGQLRDTYKLRIILTGTSTNPSRREYTITKNVFGSAGDVPLLKLKAHGITANRRFTDAQTVQNVLIGEFPDSTPINLAELDSVAERMAEEVRRSYLKGVMGAVKVGGTKPIEDGIEAGGECNEMWISFGQETDFSITTNYSIKPAVIEVTLGRKDLDGNPVKVAV